jgi:hypothetical protein
MLCQCQPAEFVAFANDSFYQGNFIFSRALQRSQDQRMAGRLNFGVILYASAAKEIANALGIERPPEIEIGHGRTTLTFRGQGASRWPQEQQIEHALQAASVSRTVLARDSRRAVRQRARRAIVIVFEDTTLLRGCEVVSRWECVVPMPVMTD